MQRPWPGPARPPALLEAEPDELADEIRVERDGVESARPSDLRPVVRFDLADYGPPALRGGGDEAVVPASLLREIGVRGPEERIRLQQSAVRRDAAVGDALDVGDLAIEPLERRHGEIRERAHRRGGNAFQRLIGEGGAEMRRSDGDERSNPPFQAQARNRVARVEPAHAVGDDVYALAGQAPDQLGEMLRALFDRSGRGYARMMELRAERVQAVGDVAEVAVASSADRDLVETEDAMGEHHRMPQPGRAARGEGPPETPAPAREDCRGEERRERDGEQDRELPGHAAILLAAVGLAR